MYHRVSGTRRALETLLRSSKVALTHVGARMSPGAIHALNASINYLEVGRWMRARGFDCRDRFVTREQLFDRMAKAAGSKSILYMEFGVYRGDSMRYWSQLLASPAAHLHGFDSFEGLPESWNAKNPDRMFSTGGIVPEISDARVRFFKGWFEDSLRQYDFPPYEQLIINIDADLYSSTALVLRYLEPRIVPGALLYFDEFSDRLHELKAFDEYLSRTGARFELVGVTAQLSGAAFRRVD